MEFKKQGQGSIQQQKGFCYEPKNFNLVLFNAVSLYNFLLVLLKSFDAVQQSSTCEFELANLQLLCRQLKRQL